MMSELEAHVIETFKALVACLPEAAKEVWLERLEHDCAEADAIFSLPVDLERRYQFVVKIDSYFGGQDTLNDLVGVRAGEFLDTRNAFFYVRWALLREYWRALGRPSHEFETFTSHATGCLVRIVPGAATYFDLDGTAYRPPSMKWGEIVHGITPPTVAQILAVTWKVRHVYGPDVTNMPLYHCGDGMCAGRRRSVWVRHEALVLV